MATPNQKPADIQLLEYRGRRVRVSGGEGHIQRDFYLEPYDAYPTVLLGLLGTVDTSGDVPKRIKPACDPYHFDGNGQNFYYCQEATVEQLAQEAIAASPGTGYNNTIAKGGDKTAITAQAAEVARCTQDTRELPQGRHDFTDDGPGLQGHAGAKITANYRPLIFMGGVSAELDIFDYVDPIFTPIKNTYAVGKNLNYLIKDSITGFLRPYPITANPATMIETSWDFTIRRVLCPRIPVNTITSLTNKVNDQSWAIGDIAFPAKTVRFDGAHIQTKIAPDGHIFYDLTYHFGIRTLKDTAYDFEASTMILLGGDTWGEGIVSWNHEFGKPDTLGGIGSSGYFPVGWSDGYYLVVSNYRYKHLFDTDMKGKTGKPMTFTNLFKMEAD